MTTTINEPTLQLSPRVTLRPGDSFRVTRGSGPVWRSNAGDPIPVGAPAGAYIIIRLFRYSHSRQRLYADAIHLATGCTHTLFIAGRPHRSRTLRSIVNRPYRLRRLRSRKPR